MYDFIRGIAHKVIHEGEHYEGIAIPAYLAFSFLLSILVFILLRFNLSR